MKRRARVGAAEALQADLGPSQRLKNGTAEIAYRADPDAPQRADIKAARAVVPWHAMKLTDPQREAACRLEVQAEVAAGAGWKPDGVFAALPLWQRGHPTERQVRALTDMRDARAILGPAAWGLAWAVVVNGVSLVDKAGASGQARAVLTGRLLAALDRLAEHWGME